MSTSRSYANLMNKQILGHQDLVVRVFGYLYTLCLDTVRAHWDIDGAFNTKLTMSASAVDTVQVDGTSLATDGKGHILDINAIVPGRAAKFQNTNAITYYVGMRWATRPEGITVNPRTGMPNFQSIREEIGYAAAPNTVTDLGNGTIRFVVDSVTEAAVSNAGRTVVVYKVIPAQDATTEAIAIETLTVAWNGTNNIVTTAGNLGQNDGVSTTAGDYMAVLLGITVKRNTNLETDPNTMFVGTVIGVGAGGTPSVFSIANQRLLKTFNDASQVLFDAYKWLTAGTVQEAFEQVVDILDSTAGATHIGVLLTALSRRLPNAAAGGGIGNIADGTFTSASRLQDVLVAIDAVLRRKQGWTLSFADGVGLVGDYLPSQFDAQFDTGLYFLRSAVSPSATPFLLGNTGDSLDRTPYVVGEASEQGTDPVNKTHVYTPTGATGPAVYRGTFKRVYFDSKHDGPIQLGDPSGNNVILEDFGARAGHISQSDMHQGAPQPFHWRNGVIKPKSLTEASAPVGASLSVSHVSGGQNFTHGIYENLIIQTPSINQTSPAKVAAFSSTLTGQAGITTGATRPVTFRNCVFITWSDAPCVKLDGDYQYIFEDCTFQGIGTITAILFMALNGAHVIIRNCMFFAPEGSCLSLLACSGVVEGCTFLADKGASTTSQTNANPQIIRAYGTTTTALHFKNNTVIIGTAASRPTGSATNALIRLGNGATNNMTFVDGLSVKYIAGTSQDIHRSATLHLDGSNSRNSHFSNISIDFGGFKRAASNVAVDGYAALVVVVHCHVSGLNLYNIATPSGAITTTVLAISEANVSDVYMDCGSAGDNTHKWDSCLHLDSRSQVQNVVVAGTIVSATNGVVRIGGFGEQIQLRGLRMENLQAGIGTPAIINIACNDNILTDIHMLLVGQGVCPAIFTNNMRNVLSNIHVSSDGFTSGFPLVRVTGGASTSQGRQNMLTNLWLEWNGASDNAVEHYGYDGILANVIARRTTGSTVAYASFGGSNTTISNVVLSTV